MVIFKMEDRAARNVQYELENILNLLTKKYNVLLKKLPKPVPSFDKKEDKLKVLDNGERRLSISEVKPFKKSKLSSEKTQKSFSARAKCKRTQPVKSQECGFPEKSSDFPKALKDSPSRFWAFMDCYCSDITIDDIKVLEKWIESHERDSEYQTLPELGVHYTSKWMEEDIVEERKEGTKSMENPKGIDFAANESTMESELFQKVEEKISMDSEQPFVKRLISSLVHENIISSPNDIMTESMNDDTVQKRRISEITSHSELNNTALGNRLRAQLIDEGILEPNLDETFDDELFLELKRLQALVIPVSKYNQRRKETLLMRAKTEISKQESQKRIQEADAKVMENYRAMAAARLKGKKMSKKELSQIKSILEERNMLIKHSKIVT